MGRGDLIGRTCLMSSLFDDTGWELPGIEIGSEKNLPMKSSVSADEQLALLISVWVGKHIQRTEKRGVRFLKLCTRINQLPFFVYKSAQHYLK